MLLSMNFVARTEVAMRANGPDRALGSGGPLNVLMVSRSDAWARAVHAAIGLRRADLVTCAADEAVARLAGTASRYTHLLVRDRDADGLTGVLAQLTSEIANPDIDMLMLGCETNATVRNVRV